MIDVERIRELAKISASHLPIWQPFSNVMSEQKCQTCGIAAPVLLESPGGLLFCKSCIEKMKVQTNREATREELIVRQNALAHADAMFGKLTPAVAKLSEDIDEYFKFAERCEQWILRSVKR